MKKLTNWLKPRGSHTAVLFLTMILGLVAVTLYTRTIEMVVVISIAVLLGVYDIIRAVTAEPSAKQPFGWGIGKVRLLMHLSLVVLFLLYWIFYEFNVWLLFLAIYGLISYTLVRLIIEAYAKASK